MTDNQSLPDIQSLTALANEIFQALPNAEPILSGLRTALPTTPSTISQRPQLGRSVSDFGAGDPPSFSSPQLERQSAATPVPAYYFAEHAGGLSSRKFANRSARKSNLTSSFWLTGRSRFTQFIGG